MSRAAIYERAFKLEAEIERLRRELAEARELLNRAEDALLEQNCHAPFQQVLDDIHAFMAPTDQPDDGNGYDDLQRMRLEQRR